MRKIFIVISLVFSSTLLLAQNPLSTKTSVFASSGFVTPFFIEGKELLQSQSLRDNGLSYYENALGERKATGDYSSNTGFSMGIGFYKPVKKVKGLRLGAIVNSGQTGATPSQSGYAEGYFFNFLNFGVTGQYFPFENKNLYGRLEAGMGSVFTKNRWVDSFNNQSFTHHFGIGFQSGLAVGYVFTPFKTNDTGIFIEGNLQTYSTRVEVNGVGDDQWRFGALHLSAGINF